ncbi:MAG TPA: hypothetical protein VHE61_10915 [Opitutaceae bacterium]|nr:hypothetical protein [Opitutaceae bacterium]
MRIERRAREVLVRARMRGDDVRWDGEEQMMKKAEKGGEGAGQGVSGMWPDVRIYLAGFSVYLAGFSPADT